MGDTVFGIDKGILRAFGLMVIVVGVLTTFFLSEYIASMILGSVYYTALNGSTYTRTAVTGESFTVYNTTTAVTELANDFLQTNTVAVYNASDTVPIGLNNFTIDYNAGNISTVNNFYNNTVLAINYTYVTETQSNLPITADTNTFVDAAQDDFVTTFTNINTGIKFAAALITVVAVILVFASFLPKKGRKGDIDY